MHRRCCFAAVLSVALGLTVVARPAAVVAQVPAAVRIDVLNARLAQEIEREDFKAVLGTLGELRKLNPALSKEMLFIEALAYSRTAQSARAKATLERYFTEVGQGGKYYTQAVSLYTTAERQAKAEAERAAAERARREREAAAQRKRDDDARRKREQDALNRQVTARRDARSARFAAELDKHGLTVGAPAIDVKNRASFALTADGGLIVAHAVKSALCSSSTSPAWSVRRYRAGRQAWQVGFGCGYQPPAVTEAPGDGTWVASPWSGTVTVSEGGLLFGSVSRLYKTGWRAQRFDPSGKPQIPAADGISGILIEGLGTLEKLHLAPAAGGGVWLYGGKKDDAKVLYLIRLDADGKAVARAALDLPAGSNFRLRPSSALARPGGGVAVAYCSVSTLVKRVANKAYFPTELTILEVNGAGQLLWKQRLVDRCIEIGAPLTAINAAVLKRAGTDDYIALVGQAAESAARRAIFIAGRSDPVLEKYMDTGYGIAGDAPTVPLVASADGLHYPSFDAALYTRPYTWMTCAYKSGEILKGARPCSDFVYLPQSNKQSVFFPRATRRFADGTITMAGAWLKPGLDKNRGENYGFFFVRLAADLTPISFTAPAGAVATPSVSAPVSPGAPAIPQHAALPASAIGTVATLREKFKYAFVRLSGPKPSADKKIYVLNAEGGKVPLKLFSRQSQSAGTIVVSADDMSVLMVGATVYAE